jgi:hypothetical protein
VVVAVGWVAVGVVVVVGVVVLVGWVAVGVVGVVTGVVVVALPQAGIRRIIIRSITSGINNFFIVLPPLYYSFLTDKLKDLHDSLHAILKYSII